MNKLYENVSADSNQYLMKMTISSLIDIPSKTKEVSKYHSSSPEGIPMKWRPTP